MCECVCVCNILFVSFFFLDIYFKEIMTQNKKKREYIKKGNETVITPFPIPQSAQRTTKHDGYAQMCVYILYALMGKFFYYNNNKSTEKEEEEGEIPLSTTPIPSQCSIIQAKGSHENTFITYRFFYIRLRGCKKGGKSNCM